MATGSPAVLQHGHTVTGSFWMVTGCDNGHSSKYGAYWSDHPLYGAAGNMHGDNGGHHHVCVYLIQVSANYNAFISHFPYHLASQDYLLLTPRSKSASLV